VCSLVFVQSAYMHTSHRDKWIIVFHC